MKKFYVYSAALIFAALMVGGIIFVAKLPRLVKTETQPTAPALNNSANPPNRENNGTAPTTVKSANESPSSYIKYSDPEGFSPKKITLKQNRAGDGCILPIFNAGSQPLVIRLSPYTPKDNLGFLYSPIAPGVFGLIDPRYRQADIRFHNHDQPAEEFSVELDKSCQPN